LLMKNSFSHQLIFIGGMLSNKTEGPSSLLFPCKLKPKGKSYFWERKDRGMMGSPPRNRRFIFSDTFVIN